MPIEISWQLSGRTERRTLQGRGPFRIGRSRNGDVVLDHPQVSRVHLEVIVDGASVRAEDKNSQNGTRIDGRPITVATWSPGEALQVGPFSLRYAWVAEAYEPTRVEFGQEPAREAPRAAEADVAGGRNPFPGALFDRRTVPISEIKASGKLAAETEYLAIGGGIGSFCWVDHLRCYGVPGSTIRVLGIAPDKTAYAKYSRLCRASQIPLHERIRSNSISTPDNIWGFPGYASRECVREVMHGRLSGLKRILQVFGEPALTESYTPRLGDVFESMDKEAARIGWNDMFVVAQAIAIRKTDDERFVIAYRIPSEAAAGASRSERERFMVARYVQLATGYPASNFLPDLQEFKHSHPDVAAVVNCYEPHDEVYKTLEQRGGTVLIRGRGIVASRVIQRIWEARQRNKNISLIHLNRAPIKEGTKYDWAQRAVRSDVQQQPFNWPKSCWGGTLRKRLEDASPEERSQLLSIWGGTTTADRDDWNDIIAEGNRDGWLKSFYGSVQSMTYRDGQVITRLGGHEKYQEGIDLAADFVVDCTGLVSRLDEAPVLADLTRIYDLQRNKAGSGTGPEVRLAGLAVNNAFEVPGMQNGRGRVWAAGVLTANGPYAAVDSFLGLQYAALRSVDQLGALRAPGVSRFGPLRSFRQWIRWCLGRSPG